MFWSIGKVATFSSLIVCMHLWHVCDRPRRGGITVVLRRAVGMCSPSAAQTVPVVFPRTRPSRSLSSGTSWRQRQWETSQRPVSLTVSVCCFYTICQLNTFYRALVCSNLIIVHTLQLMFCPSSMWSCTTVSVVQSTVKLWGTALVRPGKTVPHHPDSGLPWVF